MAHFGDLSGKKLSKIMFRLQPLVVRESSRQESCDIVSILGNNKIVKTMKQELSLRHKGIVLKDIV